MSGRADPHSAFSRMLMVEEVPPEGLDLTISATQAERQALATEDGLEGLTKLEGALHVAPWRKGGLSVTGEMRARITQICVVTLEAFESEIVEAINVNFAPEAAPIQTGITERVREKATRSRRRGPPAVAEPAANFEGEDDPADPIIEGRIDLGALVAEFLALGLDPYPRKPGVDFADSAAAVPEVDESPFAKLQAIKGTLSRRS